MNFQEIKVDKYPFSVNVMNFDDKKVLVRLNVVDKDKGKGIIIADPRALNENTKNVTGKMLLRRI